MVTVLGFILLFGSMFGLPLWFLIKNWRNARADTQIYNDARIKFDQECARLGIRADLNFSDVYTSSFIRCDDEKERIAVYAGKTNRFAIIPYRDYFRVCCGAALTGAKSSENSSYVTTSIGSTSITTEYKPPAQTSVYVTGYKPEIRVYYSPTNYGSGFVFDSTSDIGYSRAKETKRFCEQANKAMDLISSYAYQTTTSYRTHKYNKNNPEPSFFEWREEHRKYELAMRNKPDQYNSHPI